LLTRKVQGIAQGHDAELLADVTHDTDFAGANLAVDADEIGL